MDAKEFKAAEGSCIISEDVIASIACTAATEIPGVAGMAKNLTDIRGIITTNAAALFLHGACRTTVSISSEPCSHTSG